MNSIGSQNKDALQQYLEETEDEPESVETFATEPHPGPDATELEKEQWWRTATNTAYETTHKRYFKEQKKVNQLKETVEKLEKELQEAEDEVKKLKEWKDEQKGKGKGSVIYKALPKGG